MDTLAIDRLARLVRDGLTLSQAGRAVGVSKSTAHRVVVRLGIDGRRQRVSLTVSQKQHALELVLAQGYSLSQAARTSGVSRWTIAGMLRATQQPRCVASPVRCKCGARVTVVPCVACQARNALREQSETNQPGATGHDGHRSVRCARMCAAA